MRKIAEKLYDSLVVQVAKELLRLKPAMLDIVNNPKHSKLSVEERVAVVMSGRLRILADDAMGQAKDMMQAGSMTDSLLDELGINTES